MEKEYHHIIVGASRAGLTAGNTIRQNRPGDSILIVNEEDRHPYKRTHLTKKLAAGFEKEQFALYPPSWYGENRIEIQNNTAVVEILPSEKILVLDSGERIRYGTLLLATGAEPAVPPIPGIEQALFLRYASDTEAIRERLLHCRSVVVLGQGVEGVELAEQCRLMGCEVTLAGKGQRLIQRWLDDALSQRLLKLFTEQGIRCLFGREAVGIHRRQEGAKSVYSLIFEGEELETDLILASTGIHPRMELGQSIGINGERGIRTDEHLETSRKGIYAAGDVLELPREWSQGLWHSAEHQGAVAGLNMAGIPTGLIDRPARLKCEVFGDFFFSMCLAQVQEGDGLTGWEKDRFFDSQGRYLKLFLRDGKTIAGVMAGMKEGAKTLEKGIRARMAPEDIVSSLYALPVE